MAGWVNEYKYTGTVRWALQLATTVENLAAVAPDGGENAFFLFG
jgi:hypothetical protein